MTCIDLAPAAEIRCLDALNIRVNGEINRLRAAKKPCPEVPENAVADCDCYAARKEEALRSMGYSARTRVVYIPARQEWHRVTEAGGRVFDNLSTWTYRPEEMRGYIWLPADARVAR